MFAGLVVLALPVSSHDDTLGARFVDPDGENVADCLEHHDPCQSIQYALEMARPGNTIKVAEGIYDVSGVDPESFLFGLSMRRVAMSPADISRNGIRTFIRRSSSASIRAIARR